MSNTKRACDISRICYKDPYSKVAKTHDSQARQKAVWGTKRRLSPHHGPESDPPSARQSSVAQHHLASGRCRLLGADKTPLISARGWGPLNQDRMERGEGKSWRQIVLLHNSMRARRSPLLNSVLPPRAVLRAGNAAASETRGRSQGRRDGQSRCPPGSLC